MSYWFGLALLSHGAVRHDEEGHGGGSVTSFCHIDMPTARFGARRRRYAHCGLHPHWRFDRMYDLGRGDGFVQSSITLGRANILDSPRRREAARGALPDQSCH
jgi:hypothetical protein